MGGVVNVAIRFRDGRTISQERWTNTMPHWFKHPLMFAGDENHIQQYLDMTRNNDYILDPYAPGRPMPVRNSEYGLVVWDFVSNTILDNNCYSDIVSFDPIQTGGERSGSFVECANAGLIRMEITIIPVVNGEFSKDGEGNLVGSCTLTDTLAPAEAIRHGQEEYDAERISWRSDKVAAEWRRVRFLIDTKPMTYLMFPESDAGTKAMRAKLKEIEFPMTKKQGLNAGVKPIPKPREISEQEKVARELFQRWKTDIPPAGESVVDGRQYDGVAFDDLSAELRGQFMAKAGEIPVGQLRDMRLASLLGY